ncbi:MAG: hypothetical protein NC131_11485 [Roseburia sp.]|nr:hypothetical protein [Roseburia sp.]
MTSYEVKLVKQIIEYYEIAQNGQSIYSIRDFKERSIEYCRAYLAALVDTGIIDARCKINTLRNLKKLIYDLYLEMEVEEYEVR